MNETEQKLLFAATLVKDPANPFAAALVVFGTNVPAALRVYQSWQLDPIVIEEVARLKAAHGPRAFLPTLEDAAYMLLTEAKTAQGQGDRDGFTKLMKLYNETMGYIQKPGMTINNNNQVTRVMEVVNHGSEEEWEAGLVRQQEKLTKESDEPRH
jgi:hypothetical protein